MARYGSIVPRAETVNSVIFQGAPSQLINLPAFTKAAIALLFICVAYTYVSMYQPIPWFIPVILFLLVLVGLGITYLQIRFTEFIIDTERITLRKGILNRTVNSVELTASRTLPLCIRGGSACSHVRHRGGDRYDQ